METLELQVCHHCCLSSSFTLAGVFPPPSTTVDCVFKELHGSDSVCACEQGGFCAFMNCAKVSQICPPSWPLRHQSPILVHRSRTVAHNSFVFRAE